MKTRRMAGAPGEESPGFGLNHREIVNEAGETIGCFSELAHVLFDPFAGTGTSIMEGLSNYFETVPSVRRVSPTLRVRCKTSARKLSLDKIARYGEADSERRAVGGSRAAATPRA